MAAGSVYKRSGETRPGESAPALIKRYRAGMLRRTEADPTQARKKAWVEASAAYALTLDKLWARHRQACGQVSGGSDAGSVEGSKPYPELTVLERVYFTSRRAYNPRSAG